MLTNLTSRVRPTYPFCVTGKLALCLMVASQFAAAATYYVSPSGSDSNPGTSAQPFRNVSKGVAVARAGDTVVLEDGTYGHEGKISDRSGGMNGYAAPVKISTAGTSSAWITLKARNKGRVTLDCGTTPSSMGCDKYISLMSGAAYWSFEDLNFTRGAFGAIGTDNGASHIRVKGCRFENIGYWDDPTQIGEDGLGFNKTSSDWWIEGNVFHDIGRTGTTILDHGIYAGGSNVTVINNVFYNIQDGWAIQLSDGATNWLIANNTFAFSHPTQSGHIMMWNSNNNITVRNNIFYNPGSQYAIARYDSWASGCSVDNNLIVGTSTIMTDTSGCSISNNRMGGDPKFADANAFNFKVLAGGAGIDRGVAGVATDFEGLLRPQGSAPDLGAFEFQASAAGPVISSVLAASIQSTSAVISWLTDKPATGYVEYGSAVSGVDANLSTVHSIVLSGLTPGTTYSFRVGSRDAAGNLSVSSTSNFLTLAISLPVTSPTPAPAPTPTPTPAPAPAPAPTAPSAVLRAMWDFNELAGTTVADSSNNGNIANAMSMTWRSDVCGGCGYFNGINSYLSVAESQTIQQSKALTVSMWLAPGTQKNSDPRLLAKLYSWEVKLNNGYPQFAAAGKYAISSTPVSVGSWQHLAITFNAGYVKIYLNGKLVGFRENTFAGGEAITVYPYGLHVGTDASRTAFFFGILDDVRIYQGVLTDGEVSNLYSTTRHTASIPSRTLR